MAKRVKIGFLGGIGEIGKNMTFIEYGDDIIVVDAGLSFPNPEETPGIDYVIPDFTYLKNNASKVRGLFITHGHEDHIGAVPFFLKDINVPVYGSALSLGLLNNKLTEEKMKSAKLHTVEDRQTVQAGKFSVEFVSVTHSIAGSYALSITTPKGVIFMTGDFKIDHTPIDGRTTDLARIAEIGTKGVLLLMMDSTNIERQGYSMSERNVYKALESQFEQNKDKRIIVATFASNIHRVQQIINCAVKHNRRVSFSGRSMIKIADIAKTLGYLKYNDEDVVDIEKINKVPYDRLCIISTGTQGEPTSALTRMSNDDFKKVTITELDTVLLSSSPIPGNERGIYNVINKLCQRGAHVVYQALSEIHVSGHACREELKLMFNLIKPKYFMPVHGEYRHQKMHKDLAIEMGIPESNIIIPELGQLIEADKSGLRRGANIPAGSTMLDGSMMAENTELLLRDRKLLGVDGFLIAIVNNELDDDGQPIQPIIITRGINVNEAFNEELRNDIVAELVHGTFEEMDLNGCKQFLRKLLAKKLQAKLKKRPMIIPIIMN
ncbi:MAG: ribonuclease J [Clostridiales bacterium]|nr:ribonuclease J [Clostridiales bacterium]MDY4655984.1 ribonuclease J [Eubacteriales bacterium]